VFCVSDTPVYIGTSAIPPPPYFIITHVVTVINCLLDLYLIGIYQLPTLLYFDNLIHDIIAVCVWRINRRASSSFVWPSLAARSARLQRSSRRANVRSCDARTLFSLVRVSVYATLGVGLRDRVVGDARTYTSYPANTDIIIIIAVVITVVSPVSIQYLLQL
jgi:hypothetical protein